MFKVFVTHLILFYFILFYLSLPFGLVGRWSLQVSGREDSGTVMYLLHEKSFIIHYEKNHHYTDKTYLLVFVEYICDFLTQKCYEALILKCLQHLNSHVEDVPVSQ